MWKNKILTTSFKMTRHRKLPSNFYQEDFNILSFWRKMKAIKKTKIRFLVFHYIQKRHTYANASQIFLVTLDSLQKWVARYKKYGIERLQKKTIPGYPSLNDAKDNVKILD